MSEGKIEYSFKCNGLELRAIEIPLGLDLVPYVAIETIDGVHFVFVDKHKKTSK